MTTPAVIDHIASHDIGDPHTLAGEHARLMRDVARRAAPVLALLDARAWPHAEIGTLTAFLRSAVLRQMSDEEVLLYPHDSSTPPFAELSAEHVLLHSQIAELEKVYAAPGSQAELRAVLDELLDTLRRHLDSEHAVLSALPAGEGAVPSVADLAAGSDAWLPNDDAPVLIEFDRLPADQATELCIERLLRLRPGQTAELHSRAEDLLRPVCQWLHEFDPARFGFAYVMAEQDHLLRVTCRQPNSAAGIGYPSWR